MKINNLVNNGRNNYSSIYEKPINEIFEIFIKHKDTFQNMLHFLDLLEVYNEAKRIYDGFPIKILGKKSLLEKTTLLQVIFIKQLLILNGVNKEYLQENINEYKINEVFFDYFDVTKGTAMIFENYIQRIKNCIHNEITNYISIYDDLIKNIIYNTEYSTQNNFIFKKIDLNPVPTQKMSLTGSAGGKNSPLGEQLCIQCKDHILSITTSEINSKSIFDIIQSKYLIPNFVLDEFLPESIRSLKPIQKIIYFFEHIHKDLDLSKLKKLIQHVYISTMENYIELNCRITSGKEICKIRRNEGYMINGTLSETRQMIQNMILSRNANSIRIVPPFMDDCLPYYCINKECFTQPYIKNVSHNVIFNKIKEEIGESNYSKLLICIFMVFNISPIANNPPPIPYLDIYKLNRIFYKIKNDELYTIQSFKKIVNEIFELITEEFKDKLSLLQSKTEFIHFKSFKELLNNGTINRSNTKEHLETIERFIELINNNNAASSIGTLEFLDMVSKYYTTNILCKPKNSNYLNSSYKDILQTNLYPLHIK